MNNLKLRTWIYVRVTFQVLFLLIGGMLWVLFYFVYILCLIGEWYINAYEAYRTALKERLLQWGEQLEGLKQ